MHKQPTPYVARLPSHDQSYDDQEQKTVYDGRRRNINGGKDAFYQSATCRTRRALNSGFNAAGAEMPAMCLMVGLQNCKVSPSTP
jgi:hypothetical protein